jgi:hypothetical protein
MTNKPGNPMNYKGVSPVTAIWLSFPLSSSLLKTPNKIKVEITDVFARYRKLATPIGRRKNTPAAALAKRFTSGGNWKRFPAKNSFQFAGFARLSLTQSC